MHVIVYVVVCEGFVLRVTSANPVRSPSTNIKGITPVAASTVTEAN